MMGMSGSRELNAPLSSKMDATACQEDPGEELSIPAPQELRTPPTEPSVSNLALVTSFEEQFRSLGLTYAHY